MLGTAGIPHGRLRPCYPRTTQSLGLGAHVWKQGRQSSKVLRDQDSWALAPGTSLSSSPWEMGLFLCSKQALREGGGGSELR